MSEQNRSQTLEKELAKNPSDDISDYFSGRGNTACGEGALANTQQGHFNTALGYQALQDNTSGSYNNAVGVWALRRNTTGNNNNAFGYGALNYSTTGEGNTACGEGALGSNQTGSNNTAVGLLTFQDSITGSNNAALGYCAGLGPFYIDNSVFIGADTMSLGVDNITNQIAIGYEAIGKGSNTIVLGNGDIERLYCKATAITELSDARVREAIEPADLDLCCQAVRDLPVTRYKYKDCMGKYNDTHRTGFLADDVEKVFPKSVTTRDAYVPELDAQGKPIFEEIARPLAATAQSGPAKTVAREVKHQVKKLRRIENVKDITMTEAVPTLWGAVQALLRRVDDLEAQLAQKH